jgi:hypothetical protein
MDKNQDKRKRISPPVSRNIPSRPENDAEMFSSNEMLNKLSEAVAYHDGDTEPVTGRLFMPINYFLIF